MKIHPPRLLAAVAATFLAGLAAASAQSNVEPGPNPNQIDARETDLYSSDAVGHVYAEIETSKGLIEAELDFKRAPLTTMNFVGLAEGTLPFQNRPAGKPFYDGLTFHRVVPGFVIQGGDPFSADASFPVEKLGDGGPGYSFPDEFHPGLRHDAAGVLSMANDGPDTNGSQFFITLAPVNRLNYLHSVFGQVVHGLDVVKQIAPGDRIVRVTIRRTGLEAEAFHASAEGFDKLKAAVIASRKPAAPPEVAYFVDETKELPDPRVKNFNFKLANYERTTGHRIALRLLPEFKPEPADQSMGSAVKKLAAAAGITDDGSGVMVCGFIAEHAWNMRLGEATYPALLDAHGSTQELMANGTMHEKKTALAAPATDLLKQGKTKESVDAILDTLILKLDDYALRQRPVSGNVPTGS